jgi:hypothetical protein
MDSLMIRCIVCQELHAQWSYQQHGRVVTSPTFKRSVLALNLVNTLFLGARTFEEIREHGPLLKVYDVFVLMCLVAFTLELHIELIHFQGIHASDGFIQQGSWRRLMRSSHEALLV